MTTAIEARGLLMSLLDPDRRADPYPAYRAVREAGPLTLPDANLAVFATFAHCNDVLRHPAAASDRLKSTVAQREIAAGNNPRPFGQPSFLFLDPPDHTRLRRLAQQAFTPRRVRELQAEVTALVEDLLDRAEPTCDLVSTLAYPLPVAVICRLLGVPIDDEPLFGRASALLTEGLDPFVTVTGQQPERFAERMEVAQWLRGYLADLIAERRRDPRDDLISALIAAEQDGEKLREDEILATCNLLLIAGHETTVNLITNAVAALLGDPAQWTALVAQPQRAAAVIEETLRFDPPVQLVSRVAAEDIDVDGTTVARGDTIMLMLAAAQRDPDAFDRPDEFDPDRAGLRHLAFGLGPHFCLGAPLARMETQAALQALARRFPAATLAGPARYKPNVTLRGMSELPVHLS